MKSEEGRLYIREGRNYITVEGAFGDLIARLQAERSSLNQKVESLQIRLKNAEGKLQRQSKKAQRPRCKLKGCLSAGDGLRVLDREVRVRFGRFSGSIKDGKVSVVFRSPDSPFVGGAYYAMNDIVGHFPVEAQKAGIA